MLNISMANLSFLKWLVILENSQQAELEVARFLEDILEKAANLKKIDMQTDQYKVFTDYVRQVWPPNNIIGKHFVLPQFSEKINGQRVEFRTKENNNKADTIHLNGKFSGFVINMNPFNQARTNFEVDQYLEALKSSMHHEAEHIFNPGTEFNSNNYELNQSTIEYMNNPGEIKAHARQVAYIYSKKFPGQPFDINKAKSILNEPEFNQTHRNYLQSPEKWEKLGIKNPTPYNQIMRFIPHYLNRKTPMEVENHKITPEQLAQKFHETYERLAPSFGYETRKSSAKPWSEVPDNNKNLMIAVCAEILEDIAK